MITQEELQDRFTYHSVKTETRKERHELLRKNAYQLAYLITQFSPPSREQSLAITKLEEVVFWVNAAIARHEEDGVIK